MILYKDNPNLGIKVVETFNGKKEYRVNCKKIRNEYYVKDVDAFEVGSKWYRKDSGVIEFDHEAKKWVLASSINGISFVYGIVGFSKDGEIEKGYFTPNPYNNVKVHSGHFGELLALNTDILAENGFVEELSTGIWYDKKELSAGGIRSLNAIVNKLSHQKKGYNIEDNSAEASLKTTLYEQFSVSLSKDVRRYSRFLNDTTFGLEIECSQGWLPDHIQNRTGVVVCRDGSLTDENGKYGPEFTTIPLSGAKGLQNINNIANELKRRTKINEKCSLHIHLGNLPTSRLFLVSLYVLCYKIQDEIFEMFPYYKQDYTQAGKEKDYCQKLKKMNMGLLTDQSREGYEKYITDNYTKIFYWLSQNQNGSGYNPGQEWNRKKNDHPVPQKWQRKNRYYWVNLMNTMFSSRNTIEFRLHTPTTNSQKMINWLFICNAIVRYAILHSKSILSNNRKISLDDVLDYYKTTFRVPQAELLSDYLKAYFKERKDRFKKDFSKGDYLSKWDIEEDKTYEFKFGNITHLF